MKTKIKILLGISILMWLFLFANCRLGDDCFCTEVFIMEMVRLIDGDGQPVVDAKVTVFFTRIGVEIDCSQYHDPAKGFYCIMNDSYVKYLDSNGEVVMVFFEKEGFLPKTELYIFNTDECKCHINLVSGSSTVYMYPVI